MADDSTTRAHRIPVRIDAQSTVSLALVAALVGGGIQYGRQSQRLESVENQLREIKTELMQLREALAPLRPTMLPGR